MLFEEMGLNAEVVRVFAWKGFVRLVNITSMAVAFFVSVSCSCVKRQPCVSATLFLLLLLYVSYPFAFWVLVYSSLVACIYIVLGKNLSSRFYEERVVKNEENRTEMSSEKLSSALGDRTFKLNGKTILSRRSRKRIILQSADSNDPTNQLFAILANPLKFEERKMDIIWGGDLSSLNSPFVDELYSPTGDQQNSDHFVSSSGFVPCDGSSESLQTDRDCDHGHFEAESPIDDEDATLDANRDVEWTEDVQKNLMDLGNSDIERNKRLESLMAKRRVKKLLSMQLQREPSNFNVDALSTIAPIAIGKTNLLFSPTAVHGSEKLPGSAPSVLVPMRNPFDLPYDPQEERPNLTGDSFDQEFLLADQRDLNLLRHESFDLQSKFNGEPKNTTEKQESEGLSCLTFKSHQDKEPHEKLFQASLAIVDESVSTITNDVKVSGPKEQISPALSFEKLKVKDNEKSENMMLSVCAREPDKVEDYAESKLADSLGIQTESTSGGSVKSFSTLYSPSEDEVDNCDQDELLNGPDGSVSKAFIDSLRKSLIRSRSRIIARGMTECLPVNQSVSDPDSSPIENTTMVDIQCEEKQNQAARTPRHSIASDLRVEVSDSSPPLTVDTISPPDGEFLVYGADIEQEMTFGSEDVWGASSHLSAAEENESRYRVVHEISEHDIIGLGFYEVNQSAKDLTAPEMSPKKVERQDSTTRSSLALGTDRSMDGHAPPASITKNILDETSRDIVRMPLSHIATDKTIEKNLASSLDCGNTQESAKPVDNGDSAKEVCDPLLKCNGMSDIIQNGTHTVTVHEIEQAYGDNDTFSRLHLSKADKESLTSVNVKSHSGGPEVLENIQHQHDRLEEYCMEIPISMPGVGEELKNMMKCIPTYNFAKLDELNILAEDEITSKRDKNLGVHLVEEGPAKEMDAGIALQVVEIESEVFTKVNPIINLSMPEDGHIVQNDNANVKAKWEDSTEPKVAEKYPLNVNDASNVQRNFSESEGLAKGEPEVVPANFSEASNVQNGDDKAKVDENIDEKLVEDGQSKHLIADAFAEPSKLKEADIAEGSNEIKMNETEGNIEQKSVERRGPSKEMETTISMQDVGGEAKDFIIGGPLENNLSNALCPLKEVEVTTAQGRVEGELQGLLRIEY